MENLKKRKEKLALSTTKIEELSLLLSGEIDFFQFFPPIQCRSYLLFLNTFFYTHFFFFHPIFLLSNVLRAKMTKKAKNLLKNRAEARIYTIESLRND